MIKFNRATVFSSELREKVDQYFRDNNISKKGNRFLHIKTAFWITSALTCFTLLVFFTPSFWVLQVLLCIGLGLSLAGIGFNVMHDAAHGSFSTNQKINRFWAKSLDAMGASSIMWHFKHNQSHHTSPNTKNHDDDIEVSPLLRFHTEEKWHWWYMFQTIYMWPLYGILYIGWVLLFDFNKYFRKKVCDTPITMNPAEHLFFWTSKLVYFSLFLVLPISLKGFWPAITGYIIIGVVCGLAISIVFQLAHIQTKARFIVAQETDKIGVDKIEQENFIHQLETTANFATKSRFVSWLVGGLNFQIEHHLFPNISHVHYPKIRPIVKEICKKYNVEYREFKTFSGAFISHVHHMWKMSFS